MAWYSYENSREGSEEVLRQIAKRKKKGERFDPLVLDAGQKTKISTTFWGRAWCRHLESFSDYETRLPRGRSYLRKGSVYNLDITAGRVEAVVAGSSLYETAIHITPLPDSEWKHLVANCSGDIGSMFDLLAGKLGDQTLRLLTDPNDGLFPRPRQMRFQCTCPDWADMCKHVAAVLYGVGAMLDQQPELLFVLRGVDQSELIGHASTRGLQDLGQPTGDQALADADLSALFGIDLTMDEPAPASPPAATKPKAAKKAKKAPGTRRAGKRTRQNPQNLQIDE